MASHVFSTGNPFLHPISASTRRAAGRERTSPFLQDWGRPTEFRGVPIQYRAGLSAPGRYEDGRFLLNPSQPRGGVPGVLAHEYTHYWQATQPAKNLRQLGANIPARALSGGGIGYQALALAQGAAYSLLPGGPKPFEIFAPTGEMYVNELAAYQVAPGPGGALSKSYGLPTEAQVRKEISTQEQRARKTVQTNSMQQLGRTIAKKAVADYQARFRRTRAPTAGGSFAV